MNEKTGRVFFNDRVYSAEARTDALNFVMSGDLCHCINCSTLISFIFISIIISD